jgi:hypothetical protein
VTKATSFLQAGIKSPILWGVLASAAVYGLIDADVLAGPFVRRYFASHPVEYVETTMFFIGLAVMALKVVEMLAQYAALSKPVLGPISRTGRPTNATKASLRCPSVPGDCRAMLDRLAGLPPGRQNDYLVRRLREALEHVRRRGSADSLDEHLAYLADLDAARQHSSFALVRVIIWAIPILGFLGTVIGITLAIANLAPDALENSLPEVTAGLGVAFDTTALALGLSIVLMFAQFVTDRAEGALLARVDERAAAELEGCFERLPAGPDGQLAAVRRMAETVVESTEQLVRRQIELWQASMEAASARYSAMAEAAGKQLQTALTGALSEGLRIHGQQLAAIEQSSAEENRRHWDRVQRTQVQSTQAMASLQAALAAQADVLRRAVAAAGEVARLEDVLNRNLGTLAGAKHFEQTVMSLAAAIHLLNARLAETPDHVPPVRLETKRGETQAA